MAQITVDTAISEVSSAMGVALYFDCGAPDYDSGPGEEGAELARFQDISDEEGAGPAPFRNVIVDFRVGRQSVRHPQDRRRAKRAQTQTECRNKHMQNAAQAYCQKSQFARFGEAMSMANESSCEMLIANMRCCAGERRYAQRIPEFERRKRRCRRERGAGRPRECCWRPTNADAASTALSFDVCR